MIHLEASELPARIAAPFDANKAVKVWAVDPEQPKEAPVEEPELPEWEVTIQVVRIVEEKKVIRAKDLLDLAAATEGDKVVAVKRV
jgi:hypothetical protein